MSDTIAIARQAVARFGIRSAARLKELVPELRDTPIKELRAALASLTSVSRQSYDPRRVPRGAHHSPGLDWRWYIDLIELPSQGFYVRSGARYLLTVLDYYSRYAWVARLGSKRAAEVAAAFEAIIQSGPHRPEPSPAVQRYIDEKGIKVTPGPLRITADKGPEWAKLPTVSSVAAVGGADAFDWGDPGNHRDTAPIEAFNRTLLTRLTLSFAEAGKPRSNAEFDERLQGIVQGYNETRHSISRAVPAKVRSGEEVPKDRRVSQRWKLKPGDSVRLVLAELRKSRDEIKRSQFAKNARGAKLSAEVLQFVEYSGPWYVLSDGEKYRTREIYPVQPVAEEPAEESAGRRAEDEREAAENRRSARLKRMLRKEGLDADGSAKLVEPVERVEPDVRRRSSRIAARRSGFSGAPSG